MTSDSSSRRATRAARPAAPAVGRGSTVPIGMMSAKIFTADKLPDDVHPMVPVLTGNGGFAFYVLPDAVNHM